MAPATPEDCHAGLPPFRQPGEFGAALLRNADSADGA